MTDPAPPKADISEAARRTLAALADRIVPPSEKYGVPGAGDPAIVDGILEDAARRPAAPGAPPAGPSPRPSTAPPSASASASAARILASTARQSRCTSTWWTSWTVAVVAASTETTSSMRSLWEGDTAAPLTRTRPARICRRRLRLLIRGNA